MNIKNLFKKPNKSKKLEKAINEPLKAQTPSENKWLYPTDNFGKMEKGVVDDSKTYLRKFPKNEEKVFNIN